MGGKKKSPPKPNPTAAHDQLKLRSKYSSLITLGSDEQSKLDAVVDALRKNHHGFIPRSAGIDLLSKAKEIIAKEKARAEQLRATEKITKSGPATCTFTSPMGDRTPSSFKYSSSSCSGVVVSAGGVRSVPPETHHRASKPFTTKERPTSSVASAANALAARTPGPIAVPQKPEPFSMKATRVLVAKPTVMADGGHPASADQEGTKQDWVDFIRFEEGEIEDYCSVHSTSSEHEGDLGGAEDPSNYEENPAATQIANHSAADPVEPSSSQGLS